MGLEPVTRRCPACEGHRPPSDFVKGSRKCAACRAAKNAAYYAAHRGWLKARQRAYYAANREKVRARIAAWARTKPHKRRTYAAVRQERVRANGGSITPVEWRAILDRWGHRCLRCGAAGVPLVADHVVPVYKGGRTEAGNLQCLCRPCNARKGVKTRDYRIDWAERDGQEAAD